MDYTFGLFLLIIIIIMLVSFQKLVQFFNLLSLHFKPLEPKIAEPKDIGKKVLLKAAEFEKELFKHRFTRREILEVPNPIKPKKRFYRFYYYQLLDGIHGFIEIDKKNLDSSKIYFQTIYDNGNLAIDSNKDLYILNAVPKIIEFSKYPNLNIAELYKKHLKRQEDKKYILKKRLLKDELIDSEIAKERLAIEELVKRGLAKYTNYGFKLLPTFKLFKDSSKVYKVLNIKRSKANIVISILFLYTLILTLLIGGYLFLKSRHLLPSQNIIKEPEKELKNFKEKVKSFKGLSIKLSTHNYPLKESFKEIDRYLQNSKIKRLIGSSYRGDFNSSKLPCKIPKDLQKIYKWHNGIELFIPNRDFYSFKDFKAAYKAEANSNIVFIFANAYRGLAYSCKEDGLYEYSLKDRAKGLKEFYNFKHFLKVVATSYKEGAFYDDFDSVNVDLKKYIKIYKRFLSISDKHRYNLLIEYLKQKAKEYLYSTKELKLALLNEIEKTYDSSLVNSVKLYLKDSNKEVVKKAIETLGSIGNKSILPLLKRYLNSDDRAIKASAILAIANIVDSKDKGVLESIYPFLNSSSEELRLNAYEVIERVNSKESVNILKEKLNKESIKAKLEIVKIIGNIGSREDIEFLKSFLNKIDDINSSKNPLEKVLQYETLRSIAKIKSKE